MFSQVFRKKNALCYSDPHPFFSVPPTEQTLTFKISEVLYVPPALTFRNSVFSPQCIYVFCAYLRTNSDYFLYSIN